MWIYLLLFLFYPSIKCADDLNSTAELPNQTTPTNDSFWTCLGLNGSCGISFQDEYPQISVTAAFAELDPLVPQSSGIQNSSSAASVPELTRVIVEYKDDDKYGLVILEAGDGTFVDWYYKLENVSTSLTQRDGNYVSEFPNEQYELVKGLPVYRLKSEYYRGNPAKVTLIPPGGWLLFNQTRIFQPNIDSYRCRRGSLLFAIIEWESGLQQLLIDYPNGLSQEEFELLSDYEISHEFIRICPKVSSSTNILPNLSSNISLPNLLGSQSGDQPSRINETIDETDNDRTRATTLVPTIREPQKSASTEYYQLMTTSEELNDTPAPVTMMIDNSVSEDFSEMTSYISQGSSELPSELTVSDSTSDNTDYETFFEATSYTRQSLSELPGEFVGSYSTSEKSQTALRSATYNYNSPNSPDVVDINTSVVPTDGFTESYSVTVESTSTDMKQQILLDTTTNSPLLTTTLATETVTSLPTQDTAPALIHNLTTPSLATQRSAENVTYEFTDYSPKLLDIDRATHQIQASVGFDEGHPFSVISCSIFASNTSAVPLTLQSLENNNVTLELTTTVVANNYTLSCVATVDGEQIFINTTSQIRALSFKEYVTVKPPLNSQFATTSAKKFVNIVFERTLDSSFEEWPYCIIDENASVIYPATLMSLVVSCDISALIDTGTYKLIGIRSRLLQEASLAYQDPTTVHLDVATTSTASTLLTYPPTISEDPSQTPPTLRPLFPTTTPLPTDAKEQTTIARQETYSIPISIAIDLDAEWEITTVRQDSRITTLENMGAAEPKDSKKPMLPITDRTHKTTPEKENITNPWSDLPTTTINFEKTTTISIRNEETVTDGSSDLDVRLTDNLLGMTLSTSKDSFPIGMLNCTEVFLDLSFLGANPSCDGSRHVISIGFGQGASVVPGAILPIRTSFYTENMFAEIPTLRLLPPLNAVYPNFTVDYQSLVMACETTIAIEVKQIQGDGGRNLTYTWSTKTAKLGNLVELLTKEKTRLVVFDRTSIPDDSSAILSVTACNYAKKCTTSADINITVQALNAVFEVDIVGVTPPVYPSLRINLQAMPKFSTCQTAEALVPASVMYVWKGKGKLSSEAANYRIPSHNHTIGDIVTLNLTASYESMGVLYKADADITLKFMAEPLVMIFDSYELTLPSDQSVYIDAGKSFDPNTKNGTVSHSWSCLNMTSNTACKLKSTTIVWSSPSLTVPAGLLTEFQSFLFVDVINGSNMNATSSCIVTIVGARTPKIRFMASGQEKFNVDKYVRIQAFVRSSYGDLNTTWEVLDGGEAFFNISAFMPTPWRIFDEATTQSTDQVLSSLTIPPAPNPDFPSWSGLSPGMVYAIRLKAVNAAGTATSVFEFRTNSPPSLGNIDISPSFDIIAITTQVQFSVGDGWYDEDAPLQYTFGLKTFKSDNTTSITWFPQSMTQEYFAYLPAAWPAPHSACGIREGVAALLKVCDRLGACSSTESKQFTVAHPKNASVAIASMLRSIDSDGSNGNIYSAMEKFHALTEERCNASSNTQTSSDLTLLLLHTIDGSSDKQEYEDVINTAGSVMDSFSSNVLMELVRILTEYQSMGVNKEHKSKRDVTTTSASSTCNLDKNMEAFLGTYDDFLVKNSGIPEQLYFENINCELQRFCVQLDSTSERIIRDQGNNLTYVQAQSLNTSASDFVNRTYSLAGPTEENMISFDKDFAQVFAMWTCGGSTVCDFACLGSSRTAMDVLKINNYMNNFFFSNQHSSLNANKSASHIYQLLLLDPLTAASVPFVGSYSIRVPLIGYKPFNYYACHIFVAGNWDPNVCQSAEFTTKVEGVDYLDCKCTLLGILSVFSVSAPMPPPLPDQLEILFTFSLVPTQTLSASDVSSFITKLAAASAMDRSRFQKEESPGPGEIQVTLRPPFSSQQQSNSYAVQAIIRAVNISDGAQLLDKYTVVNADYTPIQRNLTGNSYARKIIAKIDRSFQTEVGNNTVAMATRWKQSLINMLRISEYRVKNEQIFLGIVFNFTITVPFTDEKNPLSAEEIAAMIQEASVYKEIDLQSLSGEKLPLTTITDQDIVQLRPLQEPNTLVIVLVVVITVCIGISTVFIGGAVACKIRTERLVQAERARTVMVVPAHNVIPPPPKYPQTVEKPPDVNLNRRTQRTITHHR